MTMDRMSAVAVLSANARLGFTLTYLNIFADLQRFGIDFLPTLSPYWEQAICGSIATALQHYGDRRYILFYDGDGAWQSGDIRTLYDAIEADPSIDAIFPCQASRGGDVPLAYGYRFNGSRRSMTYADDLQECEHGTFAATFVRMDVFRRMAEPWLLSIPGADGSWRGTDKIDSDTYFWKKLDGLNAGTGRRVVQHNKVLVGHLELMVRWPNGSATACQTLGDWFKTHRPPAGAHCPTMAEMQDQNNPL